MKKPADIPLDAGNPHSNIKNRRQFWKMRQTILQAALKILTMNVKHVMINTHLLQEC